MAIYKLHMAFFNKPFGLVCLKKLAILIVMYVASKTN